MKGSRLNSQSISFVLTLELSEAVLFWFTFPAYADIVTFKREIKSKLNLSPSSAGR